MDYSAIIISIKTSFFAIAITIVIGGLCARWVYGIKNKTIKSIIDGVLTLPLVLPPTVMGFFLLLIFGIKRPLGLFIYEVFNYKIAFSWGATVLAAIVVSFPLMYRSALGALEQVDNNLLQAARCLGINELKIFLKIHLPNALPGILSGIILAFARGLGEFGATTMIAGNIANKTRTLPLAIYSSVASGDMDAAYNYVLIIVVFSFFIVFVMNIISKKEKRFFNDRG